MKSSAGKGSSPRNCFSDNYRRNYDAIFRKESEGTKAFRELMESGIPSVLILAWLSFKYGKTMRFPKNIGETIRGVK